MRHFSLLPSMFSLSFGPATQRRAISNVAQPFHSFSGDFILASTPSLTQWECLKCYRTYSNMWRPRFTVPKMTGFEVVTPKRHPSQCFRWLPLKTPQNMIATRSLRFSVVVRALTSRLKGREFESPCRCRAYRPGTH